MYRPFREFINEHIGSAIVESSPSFTELKSQARSGGRAFRFKRWDGSAVFLFLTHVSDRDHFRLELGWAMDAGFRAWDDVAWKQAFGGASLMQPLRAAARIEPASLSQLRQPALLLARDCSDSPHPGEIAVDEGVSWEKIACLLQTQEPAAGRIGTVLEASIVESLRRGEIPPWAPANPALSLREPFRLQSRLVSWESWFEFVLCRPARRDEVEAITLSACAEAKKQLHALARVAKAIAEADGEDPAQTKR